MGSLFKKPKVRKPEATPQEKSLSRRQDAALSREIEEENRRKKSLLRATLGDKTLLSGLSPGAAGGAPGAFTGVQFAGASSTPGAKSGGKSLLPSLSPKPTRPRIPGDFR